MTDAQFRSAVHSLDHIVLAVPDLDQAAHFYTAFGLDVQRVGSDLYLSCAESPHSAMRIVPGPAKRLQRIVFSAYRDDMPQLIQQLEGHNVESLRIHNDERFTFRDPDGLKVEIVVAPKTTLNAKAVPSAEHFSVPGGRYAAPLRSKARKVRPRRFSHALFFSANVMRNVEFYSATLGLRLSDEAGGDVAFLHSPHGSDHHLIAFASGGGPGIHHSAWDVGSIHEMGLGGLQMAAAGYKDGWGIGRHVLGSNYFNYIRDPWGSYVEYSFDIDYIPSDVQWTAGHLDAEDAFFLWGPPPPHDFARNSELSDQMPG